MTFAHCSTFIYLISAMLVYQRMTGLHCLDSQALDLPFMALIEPSRIPPPPAPAWSIRRTAYSHHAADGRLTATIRRTAYSHHQTDGLQPPSDERLTATIRRTAYSHHQTDGLQPPSDGRLKATNRRTAYSHHQTDGLQPSSDGRLPATGSPWCGQEGISCWATYLYWYRIETLLLCGLGLSGVIWVSQAKFPLRQWPFVRTSLGCGQSESSA